MGPTDGGPLQGVSITTGQKLDTIETLGFPKTTCVGLSIGQNRVYGHCSNSLALWGPLLFFAKTQVLYIPPYHSKEKERNTSGGNNMN